MFIQTEATPNPATLKFIPGKPVLDAGTRDFRDSSEAETSPLASRLFEIQGVEGVFFGADFLSVTKADAKEWQHIKPAILGAVMEHFMSGQPVMTVGSAATVENNESFDEGDSEIVETIKELLDTRVRPA
ncbi:MAG: NifU N-terminal domain-containing protein, partial [Fimbriimonadaceae bacterium]|nr:NifU N-terminal domain-containing protein [Alphaproteobacteria bacterium]